VSRWLPLAALFATACWTTEFPELEQSVLPFAPRGAEAPDDWLVQAWPQGDMICPDGEPARFWLVYPDPEVEQLTLPMAVVFHDDVLDRPVPSEDPEVPATQPDVSAIRDVSALTSDHATRAVFDLLGMGLGDGTGALVAGLAASGHMVVLPSNCWGDLYADSNEGRSNDPIAEGFVRRGFDAAEFGFRMVSDDAWATINRVALPQTPDYSAPVAIGIGHGGRALGELLAEEFVIPTAVFSATLDSTDPLYQRPDLYEDALSVLEVVFEDADDADAASLANTPVLPGRTAYLYSRLDPEVPPGAHDAAVERLWNDDTAWVEETGTTTHAPLTEQFELVDSVIGWIAGGAQDPE